MRISFEDWYDDFQKEYLRRVGITWLEGCGEQAPPRYWHSSGFTPEECVISEIEKYDLVDLTQVFC